MQRISVQLQQINAAVTNNYTCYKTIWWQSQTLEWVHPHKHQHGTILYTYYTVSSYFQLAQAYDMNSTHVSSGSSFSSSGDWKSRQTLCLQTVLSHF